MRKFLLRSLLFLAPFILLANFADKKISTTLKKSNRIAMDEYSVWNDIYSGKASSEILILGSSRAWVHINPAILETCFNMSAYNLGVDGQNFIIQDLRFQQYLKYNTKPKTVIYSLDVFSMLKAKDLYNQEGFLPYMLDHKEMSESILKFNGFEYLDFYIPLIRYFGLKKSRDEALKFTLANPINNERRVKGFESQDKPWNGDFEVEQKKLKSINFPVDNTSAEDFENFVRNSKRDNINILFVYTPEYFEAQNFVSNRREIMDFYQDISKKYKIPFLDFSGDVICKSRENFYNAEHLNRKGADLFNAKLCDTIQKSPEVMTLFKN